MNHAHVLFTMLAFTLFLLALTTYVMSIKKQEKEEEAKCSSSSQSVYFEELQSLSKDKEQDRSVRIKAVYQLADESAKCLKAEEARDRIAIIKKHYYNNVFQEQLKKSHYAIPNLFRIRSARLFMDEISLLNEDEDAAQMGALLYELENITLKIYQRTHDWDSPEITNHLQAVKEYWEDQQ